MLEDIARARDFQQRNYLSRNATKKARFPSKRYGNLESEKYNITQKRFYTFIWRK